MWNITLAPGLSTPAVAPRKDPARGSHVNAPGELQPTGHNPKNNPEAYTVDRQRHWVVKRGMCEGLPKSLLATMPSHARSGTFRQWVTREEAG